MTSHDLTVTIRLYHWPFSICPGCGWTAKPKSVSLMFMWSSRRMFSGFRSRWTMFWPWRNWTTSSRARMIFLTQWHGALVSLLRSKRSRWAVRHWLTWFPSRWGWLSLWGSRKVLPFSSCEERGPRQTGAGRMEGGFRMVNCEHLQVENEEEEDVGFIAVFELYWEETQYIINLKIDLFEDSHLFSSWSSPIGWLIFFFKLKRERAHWCCPVHRLSSGCRSPWRSPPWSPRSPEPSSCPRAWCRWSSRRSPGRCACRRSVSPRCSRPWAGERTQRSRGQSLFYNTSCC